MRIFIAIELDNSLKERLSDIQNKILETGADIKVTPLSNIHLTMRFLGEIEEKEIPKIKNILENLAKNTFAFEISTGSIGAFPSVNSCRVIWLGIENGKGTLVNIAQQLNALLKNNGFPHEDKDFSAHITLGRVRSSKNKLRLEEFLNQNITLDARMEIEHIVLFKSTLTKKGAIYGRLYQANFKKI